MSKQTFYGLRAHLRVCWPGVIVEVDLAPANAHDLHLAEELLEDAKGWALGDRNYWSADLTKRLGDKGLRLLAPYKSKKKEKEPWPSWAGAKAAQDRDGNLSDGRVLPGQEGVGAGSVALTSRWLRKVLSHTMAVHFCQQVGLSPLRFAELLTD